MFLIIRNFLDLLRMHKVLCLFLGEYLKGIDAPFTEILNSQIQVNDTTH